MRYRIVETDNFNGDYPDEKFVNLPATTEEKANAVCEAINKAHNPHGDGSRYWMVRPWDYKLQPGFKP